jgi:hypothetical protein
MSATLRTLLITARRAGAVSTAVINRGPEGPEGPEGPAAEGALVSDPTGIAGADAITNIVSLTEAEYTAATKNASTLYIITA